MAAWPFAAKDTGLTTLLVAWRFWSTYQENPNIVFDLQAAL